MEMHSATVSHDVSYNVSCLEEIDSIDLIEKKETVKSDKFSGRGTFCLVSLSAFYCPFCRLRIFVIDAKRAASPQNEVK